MLTKCWKTPKVKHLAFMSNMKISQDLKDHFYVVEIGLPLLKLPFLPEKGGLPLLERSLLLDRGRSVRTLKTT